jgi:hypothetical protein
METENTHSTVKVDSGWSLREFQTLNLGDARIERRLRKVAEDLSRQPASPINQASRDNAATKAAYRLFQNEKLGSDKIIAAHRDQTLARMKGEEVVLCNQDTTYLNFSTHKATTGLGPIGDKKSNPQGLVMHSSLAVTPRGLPLGVLTLKCYARDGHIDPEASKKRVLEDKESYRWIKTLQQVSGIPNIVMQGDRENDIYEYLVEAERLNVKYNIRSCNDRGINNPEYTLLQTFLCESAPKGEIEIDLPRENRRATMEVRYSQIEIRPPSRITKSKIAKGVSCWVVQIKEINCPEGSTPVSWTLLTNVPVMTIDDAIERITWYKRRWAIEEYHRIIKSGCTVEQCRLETAERLVRYITLFAVIAWRIFWMVHIARTDPNAPAEVVLTSSEVGTLKTLKRFKKLLPAEKPINVRNAIIAIACLGGYLNRKNDPPPGPTALWRGWQQLSTMAELYESIDGGCG